MLIPAISVVMSVYNGEKYLREAVNSILAQSFTNFEFIIVDDGSADNTAAILDSYTDVRIIRKKNEQNTGLAFSLNKAISTARGDFIARMDADDFSMPGRLEMQFNYLTQNPQVAVVGSDFVSIDEAGRRLGRSAHVTTPGQVRWRLLFGNAVAHPTVMFRKSLFEKGFRYDENMQASQDYDLWFRISEEHAITNLPEELLLYRRHTGRVSIKKNELQRRLELNVMRRAVASQLGNELPDETLAQLQNVKLVENVEAAWHVARILWRLRKCAEAWDIKKADRMFIRRETAYKIKRLWDGQNRNLLLLPLLFLLLFLQPALVVNWGKRIVS